MAPPKVVRSAFSLFFEYDTPRIVHIRSKKVGIFNRLVQLIIIAYIVGYVIVWKKGYQEFDDVRSAVTTKLKGVVYTNFTDVPGLDGRIWDVADYVIPPQENNAFFVMTNVLVTPVQTQGVCGEDPGVSGANCTVVDDCKADEVLNGGNGLMTGDCIKSNVTEGTKVCQVRAWCPVERSVKRNFSALADSKNFTVFIKNNIEFPKFDVRRRNFPAHTTDAYLKNCHYNPSTDRFCPVFYLGSLVSLAGQSYENVSEQGAVMQIIITWDCNLDYDEEECLPEYSFRRLDRCDFNVSCGFNFRYADHYKWEDGTNARTLYKAYGVRFIVSVQGQAGKFNPVPLFLNVGSGLALLGISTVICDIFVLYLLKARAYYKDKKYLNVKGEDAYEVLDESQSHDADGARHRNSTKRGSDSS